MIVFPSKKLWTPSKYSGAKLHLTSEIYSSIKLTSGAVEDWSEIINSYKFSQATGANRPGYSSGEITFASASSQRLNNTTFPSVFDGTNTPIGMYAVVNITAGAVARCIFSIFGSTASPRIQLYINGSGYLGFGRVTNAGASSIFRTTSPTAVTTGSYQLICAIFDGTNVNFYINGVLITTLSANLAEAQTFVNAQIGAINSVEHFNGNIKEILITDGNETSGIREKIEGFLAHRCAILSLLDSSHPYKTTHP